MAMIRGIINFVKQHAFALSFMISISLCNYFYTQINAIDRPLHFMHTDLDHAIPFIEQFVVPYILWGPFIFASYVYLCFANRNSYYRAVIVSVIGHLVCYVFYLTYQTTVPRPEIGDDTIFLQMVHYIYSNDMPVNAFPSLHVFTTYLIMKAYRMQPLKKWIRWSLETFCALIYLSTVFIKQHVVVDIIAGILLAEVLFYLVYSFDWGKFKAYPNYQRKATRGVAARL